tara:strand:+ start:2060 stop:4657 length:2598 start_codon:yes stop_codon:yes gene_type:complete
MAGPMDIFGVELDDLKDVYEEKMVPYLDSDSFIGSTSDKAAAIMNPALTKTFDVLSLEKFKTSLPTMDELDEKFQDGTVLEKLEAQAKVLPRAGIDTMNFLFKDIADVYARRQEKLDAGIEMRDIIAEEDTMDTVLAALGPIEIAGGLSFPKKFVEKHGTKFLPVLQNIYLRLTGQEIEAPERKKLKVEDLPVFEGSIGGDPGQFSDSVISGMEEDVDIKDIQNDPAYMSTDDLESLFEDASLKPSTSEQMPEVQMAGLFGKAPLWGVAAVDKFKMLAQKFSKGEKSNLQNAEKKVGDSIIDSPETAESVFYSGLEARLMDPNTPKEFKSADAFFDFVNKKGVGKAEIEDNALAGYIESAKKNNTALNAEEMLTIIRAAPIRKIDNVVYGSEKYGGTAPVKYAGYQERGALPDSYRESVMYLPSKEIPLDPDALPEGGAAHDFAQRYVIAWSRLTDRNATVPVEKTGSGIQLAADLASLRTMKRNQTKLNNQLKGLNASAYTKLTREGIIDGPPVDTLNPVEIAQRVEMRASILEDVDPALLTQIRQFKSKIQNDSVRIKELEATTKGQGKTIVTFADEIQSDVLQNAKRFEEKLLKQMGDFLDSTPADRRLAIQQADYGDNLRGLNPEVAEFYAKNRTVFRPLFKSDVEMQQFINEFQQNKKVFEDLAAAGTRPDGELVAKSQEALKKERQMLDNLQTAISENAMRQLFPNLPFKTRTEWGEAVVKRDLAAAAQRLFVDKADDAAQWYAVSPAKFIKNRYSQSGGTNVPVDQRTKDMKGIGTEEFYGGPDSVDSKGKHYTSVLEKALKRAAKENNSEFKIIKIDGVGDAYAIKITPEMLLPHKTHRKKGGVVYTPEIIDIFEVA